MAMYSIKGNENGEKFQEIIETEDINKCVCCHTDTPELLYLTDGSLLPLCNECCIRKHSGTVAWHRGNTVLDSVYCDMYSVDGYYSKYEVGAWLIMDKDLDLKVVYKATKQVLVVNPEEYKRLQKENKQLKEALKIANPWCMSDATCRFCNGQFDHADDCKYVLLTNKSEVE